MTFIMDEMDDDTNEYKLVVLGCGGVGKSALTIRLVTDNFMEDYDPTIEDSYRKQATVDDTPALLDILDTAGQEEYTFMQDQWMREGKGFLLVYSVTCGNSFDNLRKFKDKILRAKDVESIKGLPVVVVGNKCDLKKQRQVDGLAGKALALKWNCAFMETSAKERILNEECFYQVVREIRKAEQPVCVEESQPIQKPPKKYVFKCTIL